MATPDQPPVSAPARASAPTSAPASAAASSRSDVRDEEGPSTVLRRACEKCTRSKRKCDKAGPTCGRCKRLGARCNYSYDSSPQTSSSLDGHRPRDHPRFVREGGSIASLLAAVDSFGEPQVLTITQILAATRINWRATRDSTHFPTVHRWFRIFSWSKIETTFGVQNDIDRTPFAQLQVPAADAALLMVCVWLSTQYVGPYKPGLKIEFPLYEGVKHTFSLLKCLMQPTLELMQCGALITLVEYGHGLFPTAHETLSETVAMARIYGLSLEKYVPEKALEPWTPVEEETSTLWWCLFEFDQLIHQDPTGKNLPFLMPAPAEDDLLPPNRTGDISCTTTPPLRLPLSAPASIMVGDRRRSAQSAAVLHRALVWESRWTFRDKKGITHPLAATNSDTNSDGSLSGVSPLSEREQDALDAPIRAILQAMVDQTDKWEIFCECFSMCLSAMYTLYVPFLPAIEKLLDHTPPEQLSQLLSTPDTKYGKEAKALAALKFSARFVSDLSREFNKGLQTDPSKLAETVVAPAIQTCGISMEVFLRLGDLMPDARERFEGVWRSVLWFTQRWGLGDVVLASVARVRPRRGGIVVPPLPHGDTTKDDDHTS